MRSRRINSAPVELISNKAHDKLENELKSAPRDFTTRQNVKQKIYETTKITLEGSSIHAIPNIARTKYD